MNDLTTLPPPIIAADLSKTVPTVADLIAACSDDGELSPSRKANLKSCLVAFCRKLHRQPIETLASAGHIRRYVEGVHPAQLKVSTKRWQNIMADLRFAMGRYGPTPLGQIRVEDLSPRWRELRLLLPAPRLLYGLSRFVKFCSLKGVGPEQVDAETIVAFEAWLSDVEFHKRPRNVARDAAILWNLACKDVAGWPGRPVELWPVHEGYCLSWDKINSCYRKDVAAWIRRLGIDSWHDEDAPLRPLRPTSLKAREFQMRQAYSILIMAGHDPNEIRDLAYLTLPAHAQAILEFFWERKGGVPHSQVSGMAGALLSVARHYVKADPPTIAALKRMKARVSPNQNGLTEKNRAMLRQFDDPANIERLLMFPSILAAEAKSLHNRRPRQAALLMQVSVAVEILLMMPIRLGNLASLDIEKNFDWRGDRLIVSIPSQSVKNREAIEFPLEDESLKLLREFLEQYRPTLANGTSWLFPGSKAGCHKDPQGLAAQIKQHLFRVTGLVVTPHQFRHIAARIWLDENPGAYELLRRLLVHRYKSTTTGNYTGLETRKAVEHYDRLIWTLRMRFAAAKG